MINILWAATGGAVGATLRLLITNYLKYYFPYPFFGTLLVNILGSLIIGYLISYVENRNISSNIITYFFITGILGSFTTFSAFSMEVIEMINDSKYFFSSFYVLSSLITCLLCCYLGYNFNKV